MSTHCPQKSSFRRRIKDGFGRLIHSKPSSRSSSPLPGPSISSNELDPNPNEADSSLEPLVTQDVISARVPPSETQSILPGFHVDSDAEWSTVVHGAAELALTNLTLLDVPFTQQPNVSAVSIQSSVSSVPRPSPPIERDPTGPDSIRISESGDTASPFSAQPTLPLVTHRSGSGSGSTVSNELSGTLSGNGVDSRRTYNTINVHNAPVTTINRANNVIFQVADEDLALVNSLPTQPDLSSQWTDYMAGSRTKEIQDICAWADKDTAAGLLWIHAAAGLGKSTLARQLKHHLHSQGRLGAAIFLSQLPTDSLGPETVIKLIGGELARIHHRAIPAVAQAVRQSHGASVQVLLETYVHDSLLSIGLPNCLVVIFDAIDEWRSHYHLISELGQLAPHSSLIRFIVLSRSEPRPGLYKNISIQTYPLLPVSVEVMEEYLDVQFKTIEWEFGRKPSKNEVVRLATMANGLFIWLSIVCSLLEQLDSSPQDTLTAILYSRRTVGDTNHQLATLYSRAIDQLFPQPGDKEVLRTFLGYATILQEPLLLDSFAQLSGLTTSSVKRISSFLKALQICQPVDQGSVIHPSASLFHASFLEYLHSTSILPVLAFPIPSCTFHFQLGEACLQTLIHCIPTSLDLNKLYLSPACRYAVLYWAWHMSKGVDLDGSEKWKDNILRAPGALSFLRRWAPVLIQLLQMDDTLEPPDGDDVNTVLRDVADLVDKTGKSAVIFKIPFLKIAAHLAPDDAGSWRTLGLAYRVQSGVDDSPEFIQHAVESHQRAVNITQESQHQEHTECLYALASCLWKHFQSTGDLRHLSRSTALEREILLLCPSGHPDRARSLSNLAASIWSLYQQSGVLGDLEEVISLQKEALALCPSGHPGRALSLSNLANSICSLYEQSAALGNLEEAISLGKEALALRPLGHPDRDVSLSNLATSMHSLYKQSGALGDLEEAISLGKEALALHPSGHPYRAVSLSKLAVSLHSLYQQSGAHGDLKEPISLEKEALALRPLGHPDRALSLSSVAASLYSLYQQSGALGDLEEVISLQKDALALCPSGHLNRDFYLTNLATSLHSLYKQSGVLGHLEEAIYLGKEALALRSSGHPSRAVSLSNLAASMHSCFQKSAAARDLEEAMSLAQGALALYPLDHPNRSYPLYHLANSLYSHFKKSCAVGELEEVIILGQEALTLCPLGHPYHRCRILRRLCLALYDRFGSCGTTADLHKAIALAEEELSLYAPDHLDRHEVVKWLSLHRHLTGHV